MTTVAGIQPPRGVVAGRAGAVRLVLDQVGYAARELWRSRIVLVFTFILPLVWLVMLGLVAGNDAVDPVSGVRIMQFVTPAAAVMGLLFATLPPIANSLGEAREQKTLKRLRGTPLPIWAYLVGRVGAAAVLATCSVLVMFALGVVAYEFQIVWRTMPATIVTLLVGIACLAAIGLAIGALAPSAAVAQTASIAAAVLVSFVSGLFIFGTADIDWLVAISQFFPIRHLLTALQDQTNPFLSGNGWDIGALLVLGLWTVGALAVAIWALRREQSAGRAAASAPSTTAASRSLVASQAGRPSSLATIGDQTRWANAIVWRDLGNVFFAVGMPVGLYALMAAIYGKTAFELHGMPFAFFFASGMAAYGIAVTAFINMPEAVARSRDRGILKRLHGTPLAPWHFLAGRTTSVLWIGLLTAALVYIVAAAAFGVQFALEGIPLALVVLVLGTLTIAACGYALVVLAPSGKSVAVIGLAILLPLAFLSEVFPIGEGSLGFMSTVASYLPLKPLVLALAQSLEPGNVTVDWFSLAVMAAWLIGASVVALMRWRWEPVR